MDEIEAIVQRMIDAGEPEENIAMVIQEWKLQNPVKMTPLNMDPEGVEGNGSNGNSTSQDGELVYGDQRNIPTQISDYQKLTYDIENAQGQYDNEIFRNKTVEERREYLKYIPNPGYTENTKASKEKIDRTEKSFNNAEYPGFTIVQGPEQELTQLGELDIENNYLAAEQNWNKINNVSEKNGTFIFNEDPLTEPSIDDYKEKALYIENSLVKNNQYLNFKNKETINRIDQYIDSSGGLREQIIKKYDLQNRNEDPEAYADANEEFQDRRMQLMTDVLDNDMSYQTVLKGIRNQVSTSVGEEVNALAKNKARDEVEFKIPFTDIKLPGKGISDNMVVESLQKMGKQFIQSIYGIELMGIDSSRGKQVTKEINSIQDKLDKGELKDDDIIDYDVQRSLKQNTIIGGKKGTVKEALAYLNSSLDERKEEQFETITDINDIDRELKLFAENKLWDEEDNFSITPEKAIRTFSEQGPQLALAMVFGGAAVMAQETGSNYINNLKEIAKKKYNIPDNKEPTPDQLMEIINAGEDQAGVAAATGIVSGYLEKLSAGKLLKVDLKKPVGSIIRGEFKIAYEAAKNSGKAITEGVLLESLTEGLQGLSSQVGESIVTDENRFDYKDLREQASQGALMGGGISIVKTIGVQTLTELKQSAMIVASVLPNHKGTYYAQLEDTFKKLEKKIEIQGYKFSKEEKRERLIALGQVRNAINTIPRNYNAEQRFRALELEIEKQDLNKKFENVDQSSIPQEIKDRFEAIELEKGRIADDAYITRTVDMAQKEGMGENILVANTSKEADALAKENNITMTNKKGIRAEGGISADNKTVIIDLQRAKEVKAFNVAGHEVLHRILFNTLYKANEDGKLEGTNVARSLGLELDKELNKIDPNILENEYFKKRFKNYKDQGKTMQAEEKLTILSDALRLGVIKLDQTAIGRFNTFFRRLFQNLGFKKIKFKTGKDVVNFISDYNAALDRGKTFGKAILKGEKEGFEVIRGKDGIKALKDDINITQKESISEINNQKDLKQEFDELVQDNKWKTNESIGEAANKIEKTKLLDGLIIRGVSSEYLNQNKNFVQDVKDRLSEKMMIEFNPAKNESLFGWLTGKNKSGQPIVDLVKGDIQNLNKKVPTTKSIDEGTTQIVSSDTSFDENIDNTPKKIASKVRKIFGIKDGDKVYNLIKSVGRDILKGKLPATGDKKLLGAINKQARESGVFDAVSEIVNKMIVDGTFPNKVLDFVKAADIKTLVKMESGSKDGKILAKGKKLTKVGQIDKAIADDRLPKNTNRYSNPTVWTKLPTTLEQIKDFIPKRKAAIISAISETVVKDSTPEVIKESTTIEKRKQAEESQGREYNKNKDTPKVLEVIGRDPSMSFSISEGTQNIISKAQFDTGLKDINELLKNYKLPSVSTITSNKLTPETEKEIQAYIAAIKEHVLPLLPREAFFGPSGGTAFTSSSKILGASFGSQKDPKTGKTIKDKNPNTGKYTVARQNEVWAYFVAQIKNLNEEYIDPKKLVKNPNYLPDSAFGAKIDGLSDFTIKSYKTLFDTPVNIVKNKNNGEIKKFNDKVSLIHKALWERINKSIRDNKQSASAIATYLRITGNDTGHWHKQGANFVGYSTNPKGKDGTLYEYEHAMPATAAYMYLLDVALSKGNFKPAYKAVMDNYKLIALDKAENAKLGTARLGRGMPEGWMLGKNFWWQRYFNPEVAAINGGIPTSSITMMDGKTIGDQLGIDTAGERTTKSIQASKKIAAKFNNKILPPGIKLEGDFTQQQVLDKMAEVDKENVEQESKFSISADLSKGMNDIIQAKTGIASEKTYSRVKAEVVGASKGKFDFFIPPSAEDFVGLLYKTLGKGKIGDSQMAWYKAHLLNPFARAMDNISRDRVALMNDFKALKKQLNAVPKTLRKKVPGENFTQEQAVRTYIWNKQGMSIPGMSQADLKSLNDFVSNNTELVAFADQLIAMQKGDQYAAPSEGWVAGNIVTDLMEGINTTKRFKYLEVWQQNADQIFSEANLNKLEAAYGKKYRVALENSLQRMKTGKNRSFGGDTLTGRVTDWLTNSIGAIMFFNTRSAVLQTISAINFINFKDNNIFAAGKAFANQPQYWKDFKTLFNSDFLVERRDGLKLNVNESDIAEMAKKDGVRGVISELLRLGFLPTQLADSFAIASGGSTFYRNRIKALEKEGMSKKDAEIKAFQDFRETAEESQQSSRPDRISQQQAGPLGRIILAFANTPAQYARLIKKAASDLKNGRGDAKTNISKILYYGIAQNLIFNALQQALFALAFGEEEEEEEKEKRYVNVANGMSDSLLRGMGLGGAVFSVLKNTALRLSQESDEKSPKYQDVLVKELLQISPPISSKVGKLKAAGRAYSWNKKDMMTMGWSLDNPAYLAAGQVIAATTNIPLDRAFKKIDNIRNASSSDLEAWQRIASIMGWSAWELGIEEPKDKKKTVWKKVRRRKRNLK